MNIRQTSIDCYNKIKANGLLSKRRLEVYEALLKHAPCTASEAIVNTGWSLHAVSSRFTELRNMGAIVERGTGKCSISGMQRIIWDISDELPTKLKRSTSSKKSRVNDALNAFRELYKNKDISTDEDWKAVADLISSI